jgi:hypothetical protein
MPVAAQYPETGRDAPLSGDPPNRSDREGAGDFRGPYGFGRPAHRPDPDAKYGFEPDPTRALAPHDPVPGPASDPNPFDAPTDDAPPSS